MNSQQKHVMDNQVESASKNTFMNAETTKQRSNSRKKKNETLVEYFEVPNSPFTVVKEHEAYFVVMGRGRMSGDFKTKAEAMKDAKSITWDKITQVMMVMFKINEENKIANMVETAEEQLDAKNAKSVEKPQHMKVVK